MAMTSRQFFFSVLTAALLQTASLLPMVAATKALFFYTTTGLRYLYPFVPTMKVAGYRFMSIANNGKEWADLPDASPELTHFVRERMKVIGIANTMVVRVKIGEHFSTAYKTLIFPQDAEEYLHSTDTFRLNGLTGATDHELIHLKNNDFATIAVVAFVIPVATMILLRSISAANIFSTPYQDFSGVKFLLHCFKAVVLGRFHGVINQSILNLYKKYREQRADDGISDDLDVLEVMHSLTQSSHESIREKIRIAEGELSLKVNDKHPFLYEWIRGYGDDNIDHPSYYARMKKFEKRIDQING